VEREAGEVVPPPERQPVAAGPEWSGREGALRAMRPAPRPEERLRQLPVRELVTEMSRTASMLVRKEVELARNEAREDLRAQIKTASGLGVAGLCGVLALEMLLVTIAFALQESGKLSGWVASLLIAAVVLVVGAVAGLWGWAKRVRKPLDTTRRSIQENVRWARDRIA
jgi:uncharacterized membrane protein YqjE